MAEGGYGMRDDSIWYRVEYQGRGSIHIHGCGWRRDDPDLVALGRAVLHGEWAHATRTGFRALLQFA